MRILLLTPSFFGYEDLVANAVRELGHQVDVIDERPSNRAIAKAVVRIAPFLLQRGIDKHYRLLAKKIQTEHYDGLFVIKGEVVPRWFLDQFSKQFPHAPKVYYTFDSLRNSPQGYLNARVYDHLFTFDRADSAQHPDLIYKPLFFASDYEASSVERKDKSVSFVGTLHGRRYEFVNAITRSIAPEDCEIFLYVPARWYAIFLRVSSRRVRNIPAGLLKTIPMARPDVAALFKRSKAVIDVQRPNQTGLTMRTFEVLASGAGLITSNESILLEPFYDPDRILLIDPRPEQVDADAVAKFIAAQPPHGSAPPEFGQYSLSSWTAGIMDVLENGRTL